MRRIIKNHLPSAIDICRLRCSREHNAAHHTLAIRHITLPGTVIRWNINRTQWPDIWYAELLLVGKEAFAKLVILERCWIEGTILHLARGAHRTYSLWVSASVTSIHCLIHSFTDFLWQFLSSSSSSKIANYNSLIWTGLVTNTLNSSTWMKLLDLRSLKIRQFWVILPKSFWIFKIWTLVQFVISLLKNL